MSAEKKEVPVEKKEAKVEKKTEALKNIDKEEKELLDFH